MRSGGLGRNRADSPVITLSSWVLFSVEMGSDGGTRALTRAPCAAASEAEAMASATTFAPSKKPFRGLLAVVGTSSLVG